MPFQRLLEGLLENTRSLHMVVVLCRGRLFLLGELLAERVVVRLPRPLLVALATVEVIDLGVGARQRLRVPPIEAGNEALCIGEALQHRAQGLRFPGLRPRCSSPCACQAPGMFFRCITEHGLEILNALLDGLVVRVAMGLFCGKHVPEGDVVQLSRLLLLRHCDVQLVHLAVCGRQFLSVAVRGVAQLLLQMLEARGQGVMLGVAMLGLSSGVL
mmetsp:Transcript_108709/g.232279  ORF Transcript_108709/g.232279 Transcript_108709/m.232279 type:complete len:215 (-) Transcript_108709:321-965(-)